MTAPGSSPLARGLPVIRLGTPKRPGIIPARAGFTFSPTLALECPADHPRSRGVYSSPPRPRSDPRGSSPLARGLPLLTAQKGAPHGIIPARAGFTGDVRERLHADPDHPRSRGVYLAAAVVPAVREGSSPLARGLRLRRDEAVGGDGIIPARAGFTTSPNCHPICPRDHPRSRGVYLNASYGPSSVAGSSPLARGLPSRFPNAVPERGIIPARAGFTDEAIPASYDGWDHPRSRGVYEGQCAVCERDLGSSPLARGLLWDAAADAEHRRIIPARAGFT